MASSCRRRVQHAARPDDGVRPASSGTRRRPHLHEAVRKVQGELEGVASHSMCPVGPTLAVHRRRRTRSCRTPSASNSRKNGFRVLLSADPNRALHRYEEQPYHALIVDAGTAAKRAFSAVKKIIKESDEIDLTIAAVLDSRTRTRPTGPSSGPRAPRRGRADPAGQPQAARRQAERNAGRPAKKNRAPEAIERGRRRVGIAGHRRLTQLHFDGFGIGRPISLQQHLHVFPDFLLLLRLAVRQQVTPGDTCTSPGCPCSRGTGRGACRASVVTPSRFWRRAVPPRQQMNFGRTSSSWRSRYSRQLAASSGIGVRLPGGRHFNDVADVDFFALSSRTPR